jgi:hypothetical protein
MSVDASGHSMDEGGAGVHRRPLRLPQLRLLRCLSNCQPKSVLSIWALVISDGSLGSHDGHRKPDLLTQVLT